MDKRGRGRPRYIHAITKSRGHRTSTTVVLASDLLDPGLKALIYGRFFRGLKASAPSESPIYNCSTSESTNRKATDVITPS